MGKLACWLYRHPVRVSLFMVLLCLFGVYGASRLRIDADLGALLPENAPRVIATNAMKSEVGIAPNIVILLENAPQKQLILEANQLAQRLQTIEHVDMVQWQRPASFFQSKGLYYLPLNRLQVLASQVKKRKRWAYKKSNPFFINLKKPTPAPKIDVDAVLKGAFKQQTIDETWLKDTFEQKYYINKNNTQLALFVYPSFKGSNLAHQRKLFEQIQNVTKQTISPKVNVRFGGGLAKAWAQEKRASQDMGWITLLGIIGVLAYLSWYFRSLPAVLILILPMTGGTLCALGFAGFWFGTLSILTIVVVALLMGLGIDHGIHLLDKYVHARQDNTSEDALRQTFGHDGIPVLLASCTTIVGFGALGLSEFRAFHEFGLITASGITAIMVANLIWMPALIRLLDRGQGLQPRKPTEQPVGWLYRNVFQHPKRWCILTMVGLIFLGAQSQDIKFEYGWRALGGELEAFEVDDALVNILGRGQSRVVLFAQNMQARDDLLLDLEKRKQNGNLNTVHSIISTKEWVPQNQAKKHIILQKLHADLQGITIEKTGRWQPAIKALKTKVPDPFTFKDLPRSMRQDIEGKSSSTSQRMIILFARDDLNDARLAMNIGREIDGIQDSTGRTYFALGLEMLPVDIVRIIKRETPKTLLIVFIIMALVLGVGTRHIIRTFLCLFAAGCTLIMAAGIMALFNVQLNYFNFVLVAITAGMAVDGAIHLVWLFGKDVDQAALHRVSRANVAALLTTSIGFGVLIFASHPGVKSIGVVALIGLGSSIVIDAIVLPACLLSIERRDA